MLNPVNSKKILYLIRGLPGSGKTTFAKSLSFLYNTLHVYAADNFFYDVNGVYNFNRSLLPKAHEWCHENVKHAMIHRLGPIIVHNTSTTEREVSPYITYAKEYGYTVVSLIVENRHGSENIHGVPEDALDKMENRFSVKLR